MITLIGSGNVATWIAQQLADSKEFPIGQIYSRNIEHARSLAKRVGAEAIDDLANLNPDSELYLFAIKDDAFAELLLQLPFQLPLAVHTAGSVSKDVLQPYCGQCGVVYPLQTFTKTMDMQQLEVPLCLELEDLEEQQKARVLQLASELSSKQYAVDEAQRAKLHLAAVFACNFSNALYDAADQILSEAELPFEMLLPLMEQTLLKVKTLSPALAQTGPAKRGDLKVIEKQRQALGDSELIEIYDVMTKFIMKK